MNEAEFADIVNTINMYFAQAEELSLALVAEGCCSFLTLFTLNCCMPTRYERRMNELQEYLDDINGNQFRSRGIFWSHPRSAAYRHVVVTVDSLRDAPSSTRTSRRRAGDDEGLSSDETRA